MYNIDSTLIDYYSEIDPKKRLVILDSINAPEFVHKIYHERYSDHEHKGRKNVDWWLWRCICLQSLYSRGGFLFFRKFRDNEIKSIINELFINDDNDEHKSYLYHEYRNTAKRYLSTCKSSSYASSFMGLRQASDEAKIIRACEDIWQMSKGIEKVAGIKLLLWSDAFRDELFDYDEICREEYKRLEEKQK